MNDQVVFPGFYWHRRTGKLVIVITVAIDLTTHQNMVVFSIDGITYTQVSELFNLEYEKRT